MDGVRKNSIATLSNSERTALSDRKMLDAAIELILTRGTDKTTLKDVGERAGYSRGLAGYRFGSKAGLFKRVIRLVAEDWLQVLQRSMQGKAGFAAISSALDEHCQFCLDASDPVRAFYILWFESIGVQSSTSQIIMSIHDRRKKDIVDWLAKSGFLNRPVAEAMAGQMNATLLGIVYQWLSHPHDHETIRNLHDDLKTSLRLVFENSSSFVTQIAQSTESNCK